jgi:hypothetical protein
MRDVFLYFMAILVYITVIWYILWPFGILYDHLVYFMAIWYIFGHLVYFPRIGMLPQEKYGNPGVIGGQRPLVPLLLLGPPVFQLFVSCPPPC